MYKFIQKCLVPVFLLLVAVEQVYAFKIDTHVWVSQQVLNDVVTDGKVTIPPYGTFTVNSDIVNALRNYPDEFRMGAIGPDGFPDLLGGQQTVHPGVPGGWKTDAWLKWMLENTRTSRQKAFAYRYLNHASADTFAHTYVNTYAGDIFNLLDGQEAELRHMALEELIKNHMPPIRDNLNRVLKPYQVVEAPAAFLRDTLILNNTVASQYRKQEATMYLALMYDQWKAFEIVLAEIEKVKTQADATVDSIQSEIHKLEKKISSLKDMKVSYHGIEVNLYPAYCFLDPGTCLLVLSTEATLALTAKSLEVPQKISNLAITGLEVPIRA